MQKKLFSNKWCILLITTFIAASFTFITKAESSNFYDFEFIYKGLIYKPYCLWSSPANLEIVYSEEYQGKKKIEIPDEIPFRYNGVDFIGSVTHIPAKTFQECYNLETIKLPSTLKSIGCEAFNYCNISHIDLPEGLQHIGAYAFGYNNLESLTIPESLLMLEYRALSFCPAKKIELPSTLLALGGETFYATYLATDIYCHAKQPPYATDCDFGVGIKAAYPFENYAPAAFVKKYDADMRIKFGPDMEKCVLHVPAESVELYRNAEGWKHFQNIVAIEDDNDVEETEADTPDVTASAGNATIACGRGSVLLIYNDEGICVLNKSFTEPTLYSFDAKGYYIINLDGRSTKVLL